MPSKWRKIANPWPNIMLRHLHKPKIFCMCMHKCVVEPSAKMYIINIILVKFNEKVHYFLFLLCLGLAIKLKKYKRSIKNIAILRISSFCCKKKIEKRKKHRRSAR